MSSDDDENECPLCMEEMDMSDRNFKPCPCGYQICRFCWNHIKENLNGRCPACRREYSDTIVEFTPVTPAEIQRFKNEKKQKEREKKEMEANNRRHLANMRVVQKSLVYVIGLSSSVASDERTLRQPDFFGQFGKILKIVVNKKNMGSFSQQNSVGVYVTFSRKEDAAKCISVIDGTVFEGRVLRASYGTTKYCSYYLRGLACQNPGCMYLHEPGEDADSYTKEEMSSGKHHAKTHINSNPNLPLGSPLVSDTVSTNGLVPTPFGIHAPPAPPQEDTHLAGINTVKNAWKSDYNTQEEPIHSAAQSSASNATALAAPSSPSALPRTAAWASRISESGMTAPSVTGTTTPRLSESKATSSIPCDIYRLINPLDRPAKQSLSETTGGNSESSPTATVKRINTSQLHRYLFLARQAKEYFAQISGMMMFGQQQQQNASFPSSSSPNLSSPTPFAFDPFGVGLQKRFTDSSAAADQSRFGFAQNAESVSELSDQFQRLATAQVKTSPQS